jgi:hypothetical protein
VAVQAGVVESKRSTGVRWFGPFEYLTGQFGVVLLGFWFVAWVAALLLYRPRTTVPPGVQYLWWMSVPTFVVFLASSVRASGQLNWPVAAYLSGAVLVAGWLRERITTRPRLFRRILGLAFGLGFVVMVLIHDTRMVTRLAGPFVSPETSANPMPIRAFDPAARLKGYRQLGQALDAMRADLAAADGTDPILAGLRWDVPGLLGFYADGHPQAYTLGLALGIDRHSQYDLWHPNPVDDAQAFRGRTFLVVGGGDLRAALGPAFETVGPPQEVVYREHGRALARWYVCICRGFKGFDPARRPGVEAGH